MAFALFCVLNVMTGVFVENASKMTSADEAGLDSWDISQHVHPWHEPMGSRAASCGCIPMDHRSERGGRERK